MGALLSFSVSTRTQSTPSSVKFELFGEPRSSLTQTSVIVLGRATGTAIAVEAVGAAGRGYGRVEGI